MLRNHTSRRINAIAAVIALVVVAAIVVIVVPGSGSDHRSHDARGRTATAGLPFAKDSIWNSPLSAHAAVAGDSAALVGDLTAQVGEYHAWINTYEYSIPVYKVPAGARTVPVTLDTSGAGSADELATAFREGVPIPAGAHAAKGTDESMVVWQPSANKLWEFWHAQQIGGRWHARWGGVMTDVSSSPGYYTDPNGWGGSASSLSILGGLMLPQDLRSGSIDHALALALPHTAAGKYVFPAQRTDGDDTASNAIPEGTRFRLKPDVNIAALHLPPLTAMMARAAQRYGIYVRDRAGAVTFYGQDPTTVQGNVYSRAFGGKSPGALLAGFPWADLEVVAPARP